MWLLFQEFRVSGHHFSLNTTIPFCLIPVSCRDSNPGNLNRRFRSRRRFFRRSTFTPVSEVTGSDPRRSRRCIGRSPRSVRAVTRSTTSLVPALGASIALRRSIQPSKTIRPKKTLRKIRTSKARLGYFCLAWPQIMLIIACYYPEQQASGKTIRVTLVLLGSF